MPSVITLTGSAAGDACKWTKRNKRTGCQARICHTGRGKSGWQIVENVCGTKQPKAKRRRKAR